MDKGRSLREKILRSVENLPPMPQIMHRAQSILRNPNLNLKELADLIETDQALAIKVLRLSNSAYYRRLERVSSIQEAAVVLGLRAVGELLTVTCTSKLLGRSLLGYDLPAESLWRHSLSVAVGARIIAKSKCPPLADDAFSAGLIHDAGKLILDEYILERKDEFSAFLADGNETFLRAERKILGFDHAEIAARVCENWSFPKAISTPVRYHHDPSPFRSSELAYIVHVADQIAIWSGMDTDGITVEIGDNAFEVVGIQIEEIGTIMDEIISSVDGIVEGMAAGHAEN